MRNMERKYLLLIVIFLLAISSCTSPATNPPTPATQTTIILPTATSTLSPTGEPTLAPSPLPTNAETVTPITTNLLIPNGLVTVNGTGDLVYYDLQGNLLGERQSPNLGTGSLRQVHIAGPLTFSPGPLLPPLLYYLFTNGGELWLNDGSNLSLVTSAPNLYSMVGVPGKSIVAYSLLEYTDVGLRSLVFIGDPQTLPSAISIMNSINSQSYAIKPLAIEMKDNQPAGIWYTTVPYGIGGDIVFDPRSALYFLDLLTYDTQDYLDISNGPAGLSSDQSWLAYTPTGGNGPMSIVHNFDFSTAITFPLRENSDRGAGDAVFSPDNQLIAWREAGGSLADQPSTFQQTIRIARVDGTIISEIPQSSFADITGFSEIGWVVPAGWVDPQTLAVEVQDYSGKNSAIIKVNSEGSGLALLAPGSFIGFLYP